MGCASFPGNSPEIHQVSNCLPGGISRSLPPQNRKCTATPHANYVHYWSSLLFDLKRKFPYPKPLTTQSHIWFAEFVRPAQIFPQTPHGHTYFFSIFTCRSWRKNPSPTPSEVFENCSGYIHSGLQNNGRHTLPST